MSPSEVILGLLLALTLVAVAIFFGRRQLQTLNNLRTNDALAGEERRYLHRQVRRRLICSILMVLFAAFLVGWLFIAGLLPQPEEAQAGAEPDRALVHFVAYYWMAALLVLFAILVLASLDFFATARYGMHQKKLLNLEHRANLEIDAARIRKERRQDNGDG